MAVPKLAPIIELSPLEVELREMWDKARSDFRKHTKRELRADNNKRLDDVLQELENKHHPKDDEVSTKAKIRTTINRVLKCIQMLGGLAAEGASIVFGPTTLCFNAISFLIDVPNRIAEVYEGIGNLFEEMAHTLGLFRIYGNYKKLDPELKRGTHGLMVSFVRICGLSFKIIDGGTLHRFKVGAKVTFLNDDSGVKDELADFKELIKKQADVTGALNLQHVISTEVDVANILENLYWSAEPLDRMETGINVLVADVNEKKMEKITSDRVDTIAQLLSAPRNSYQQAKKALQDMRDTLLNSQWLFGLDAYKHWISLTDSIPLLLLCGPPKSGKSFLIASIYAELHETIPTAAIAYYAFAEQDSKSTKDKGNDDMILASALKSMALQLASQNKGYAKGLGEGLKLKEVGTNVPDSRKDSSAMQWWKKLHFSKSFQAHNDANVVLIFDGLERLSESTSNKFLDFLIEESRLSAKSDQPRLRILATGKKEHPGTNVNNIQIVEENRPDIKSYIKRALDKDDVLQGQHVEMIDLLKSIQEELPEVASGSYSAVDQKLARIKEAVEADAYSDDVTAIIREDPSEDPNKLARKVISDLNATLNDHDIKQLNELLEWTIFGFQYFTIDQIRAALFLKSGRSPLQHFEKKLKSKYKKVLILEYEGEIVVDDYIEDLFRNSGTVAGDKVSASDLDDAKITMTISINHADILTVQQFCWDLTERVGLGKFDFLKANSDYGSRSVIHCDFVNAHYHMTEQLLNLLNDEAHEKTKPLVGYALIYLPQHLEIVKDALDENELGAAARKVIAKRLVDLLSDIEGIKKFWDTIHGVYEYWASPTGVRIIEDWLSDPETLKQLDPKERRWVRQHTGESTKKGEFYKPITLMGAGRWLQDRTWNALDTFEWVDNFIKLQEPKVTNSGNEKADPEDAEKPAESLAFTVAQNGDDNPSPIPPAEGKPDDEAISDIPKSERISAAATWAEEKLNAKVNSLWNERIGQTCLLADEFEPAIEWFDKAKGLSECHWAVNEGQALAYAGLGKLDSACREMEIGLAVLRSLKKDEKDREALIRNLKKLASWYEERKATDRAFSLHQEVLEVDSHSHEARCHLLKALYGKRKEDEARNLVLRIKDQPGKDAEIAQFLREIHDDTNALNIIVLLALSHETFSQAIQQALQSAVDDARRNCATLAQSRLWLYHGILLARATTDFTLLQQAVDFWEQIIHLSSGYELINTQRLAARYATQYYFEQATKQSANLQDIEKHFKKLQNILRIAADLDPWRSQLKPFIASYYVHRGDVDKARKVFMDEMEFALEILTDADPDNDIYGYKTLANILMHTGDDLNALSAWSLLGPDDTYPDDKKEENVGETNTMSPTPTGPDPKREREGSLGYNCDGRCGHSWTYASDMYICRYCPDTQFNAVCLERLKSNKLERFFCRPNHSWLHVPVWSDTEALEVGKGKVRVHGELVDGKRVGGDIVDIEVWQEEIREKWGIAKKVEEPEPVTV